MSGAASSASRASPQNESLRRFYDELRLLAPELGRPFLCEGSPLTCDIACVGINPATSLSLEDFWVPDYGCDRAGWMHEYRRLRQRRHTPTRNRLELLIQEVAPLRVLELNLWANSSPREEHLLDELKDTTVFEFMLQATRPRLMLVHGRAPRLHIEAMLRRDSGRRVALPVDALTTVIYRGMSIDILVASAHLSIVKGGNAYVKQLARRLIDRTKNGNAKVASEGALVTRPSKSTPHLPYGTRVSLTADTAAGTLLRRVWAVIDASPGCSSGYVRQQLPAERLMAVNQAISRLCRAEAPPVKARKTLGQWCDMRIAPGARPPIAMWRQKGRLDFAY